MDLDWRFIAIFFVLSFPTTVVLLTVDSIYLGNRSVNVSALNPWVLSLVDWLLLNKSFYFSRLPVVSSFSLTLSFCISLPLHAGRQHWWWHRLALYRLPPTSVPGRTLAHGASCRLLVRVRCPEGFQSSPSAAAQPVPGLTQQLEGGICGTPHGNAELSGAGGIWGCGGSKRWGEPLLKDGRGVV